MNAVAFIVLILSGIILMACVGVGPFAKDPWFQFHLKIRRSAKWIRYLLLSGSTCLALLATLTLIGLINP